MTPTSFEFTVTMPGDARLVDAVRQLAAQTAGYAQLPAEERHGWTSNVVHATEAAIESTSGQAAPIEFCFSGTATVVTVVISCEASGHTSQVRHRISS